MASNNDEFSGTDSDGDSFNEDMEALRRACILSGANPNDLQPSSTTTTAAAPMSDDSDDDLELVRSIQQRFSVSVDDDEEPLNLKPLFSLAPGSDGDSDDDFETLRAIQRRFSNYTDSSKICTEDCSLTAEQVGATNIASEKETSNTSFVERTNLGQGFSECVDTSAGTHISESINESANEAHVSDLFQCQGSDNENLTIGPIKGTGFPNCARTFFDAIKKNRACQKIIRSKLMLIEARIEENKKLMERVKILKDFQVTCRQRTGRALSQKRDARAQLISTVKPRSNAKVNDKKVHAMYLAPPENLHVAKYRTVLTKFPVLLSREKWSKGEQENLAKGIKQQLQESLFSEWLKRVSDVDEYTEDSNNVDSIMESIRGHDITPEELRKFLPQVNWDQLASTYVIGRSAAECKARWLNCEDPLINQGPWTTMEDKNLLHIVQQRGIGSWIDIAVSLDTNRTPFQCLARYQRSLNASILKREWTEDEDNKLRSAVEAVGETNWQLVASKLEGRTGTQCSNRWKKTLHPTRQRVGKWDADEDKRLKVAVMLFGAKNWKKIANYVLGRTEVQCRERWVNCLDPSLNMGEWTEDEDTRLKAAIREHGYCWSKVAACIPPRTDSQCRRRWKILLPDEVPLLQAARRVQKAALISNFVDREAERPALGPNDFVTLPLLDTVPESEKIKLRKRKPRQQVQEDDEDITSHSHVPQRRSKRRRKDAHNCFEGVLRLTDGNEVDDIEDSVEMPRKKRVKRRSLKNIEPDGSTKDRSTNGEEVRDNELKKKFAPTRGKRALASSAKPKKNRARKKPNSCISEDTDETNIDDVQKLCSDGTSESTQAYELSPSINTHTLPLEDTQEYTNFDEAAVFNHTGETLSKKRRIKGPSKKYRYSGPTLIDEEIETCGLSAVSHSPPIDGRGSDDNGARDDNNEELPIRCSTPDILDSCNPKASNVNQLIQTKRQKGKKLRRKKEKCSDQTMEDGDGITLASSFEKSRTMEEDGDDITLASFLQQSKITEKSDGVDMTVASFLQHSKTSTVEGDGVGNPLGSFHQHSKKCRKSASLRSSEMIRGNDEDDMTLASFCSKLKGKKKHQVMKTSK